MKKLIKWIYKKCNKTKYVEIHTDYLNKLENTIQLQQLEIKNLKKRLNYYNNKGAY